MKKGKKAYFILIMACITIFAAASIASAAVDKVICVPWQGDINKQHTAISGQAMQLKCVVKTTDTSMVWYKWVFGDGTPDSGISPLSGSTKYNVETTHTYTAATGTPFTAQLLVANNNAVSNPVSDPYLLKIEENNLDSKVNIGIDKGLWWLYKQGGTHSYASYPHTYDNSAQMTWLQTAHIGTLESPTASAVHAFGINGHKIHGDPDQDPYVEAVQGGMNYLVKGYFNTTANPALQAVTIGTIHGDDPEAGQTLPNGLGIQVYGWAGTNRTPYQSGQIMDAIIASGVLPSDLTGRDFAPSTPKSHNWTYGELLQDMADMHAWGQWDYGTCNGGICGSWWYYWNYASPGDNSASQWPAIGMIPAQQPPWNVVVPQWVKTYNANWLAYSNCTSGPYKYFSYNAPCGCAGDSCFQTTTSGMVQMDFVGQTTADSKWGPSRLYIADNWYRFLHGGSTWGGYMTYGWYSFAKAMRLSLPSATTQIVKSTGTPFDWYYGDTTTPTCTNESNCRKGMAQRILETQSTDGSWQSGNLTNPPLTSAWMIITLRPTLFAAAPVACFNAAPNPSYPDQPITFNPSCSGHSETGKDIDNLVLFEWDWNNDGTYDQSTASPTVLTHQFACLSLPCLYPVKLRVTDDSTPALTATTVVNINITNPPHPPVADPGGPYTVSLCSNDSLKLDGSKSFDQDEGTYEAGCTTCPNDTITAWDWDLTPPLTGFNDVSGEMPTITPAAYFTAGTHNIGLRVTDNTALAYPHSGQPNLTNAAFTTVDVKAGCICNLAARAKLNKIQLTWTHVGAPSYDIYRSTAGPNTGFVLIANDYVTTYATYLDTNVVLGTRYWYRVVSNGGNCTGGSNAASAIPTTR